MKKKLIQSLVILVIIIAGVLVFSRLTDDQISSFEECVDAGNAIMENFPRKCRTEAGELFVEDVSNEQAKHNLIRVTSPDVDQLLSLTSPVEIKGEARGFWFFEGDFPIRLIDEKGEVLGTAIATAENDWMTEEFVPFTATLTFTRKNTSRAGLFFEKDNPSGLPEHDDHLRFPVVLADSAQPTETMVVKPYFVKLLAQPDPYLDCSKVVPVEREVPKTVAMARAALEELLKGVTASEQDQGFTTAINEGVVINDLTINNGVARVDLNDQLEFQVSGSCLVTTIQAQITETLNHFSTVHTVIISVDGRIEDILQP